jgi:plasmid maintenance system antidote protein VapI
MNTIEEIDREIQASLEAARHTHEYRAQGASLEFTEQVIAQMQAAGITRAALAKKIGVAPAYVTKILRGETNFTLDTMVKIAHALGCEYRCHLQPQGMTSQWFDVMHTGKVNKPKNTPPGLPTKPARTKTVKPAIKG